MIKVKNATKRYYKKTVLKDIDLEIKPGTFTTLLGENGSGKSTLLNMIAGLELPDDGEVEYKGENLGKLDFTFTHDIFFVHEKLEYYVPMTVREFVSIYKERIPNWDQDQFDRMVKDRKIDIDKSYQDYSRGQKMQVALMIGLASNVPVLLLDEITSVIDVYGRKYFLELLDQYVKKGNTVFITTNIIDELEFYTERIIILKNQGIILDRDVKHLGHKFLKIRRKQNEEHKIYLDDRCVWAGVNSDRSITYIISNELASEYGISEEMIDRRNSTLEDIFIYYFSSEFK